jgi:hypothetical protein
VGLLIRQINERLTSKLDESVTKKDFDGIFKRVPLGQIETGPSFEQIIESVTVDALGPCDAKEVFSGICRSQDLPVSVVATDSEYREGRCSTGVRMTVGVPFTDHEEEEFIVTDEIRRERKAEVSIYSDDRWRKPRPFEGGCVIRSLDAIEKHNAAIRKENEKIRKKNAKTLAEPRDCEFVLSPINVSLSISIVDSWLQEAGIRKPVVVEVRLQDEVLCEGRIEAISAKIHGSELLLREDGTLLWAGRIILGLCSEGSGILTLTAADVSVARLSDFRLQDLISTLFQLNILSAPAQRSTRRKR